MGPSRRVRSSFKNDRCTERRCRVFHDCCVGRGRAVRFWQRSNGLHLLLLLAVLTIWRYGGTVGAAFG